MAILVVIDMQPEFTEARCPVLRNRIIRRIRRHKGPVCLVEYEGAGKTYPSIVRACRGKRLFRCIKDEDGGGVVIAGATLGEGLGHHRHYILCGVNTAHCVTNTANKLLRERAHCKVTIDWHCCRTQGDGPTTRAGAKWNGCERLASTGALCVWLREEEGKPRSHRRRFVTW